MVDKTRIKITTDCNSVSYQCQYYCGFGWWWQDMHVDLETLAEFDTTEQAQTASNACKRNVNSLCLCL